MVNIPNFISWQKYNPCNMVIYPYVLNSIIAIGRPGCIYPTTNSVITFLPISTFVAAFTIPSGTNHTTAMISETKNAHAEGDTEHD